MIWPPSLLHVRFKCRERHVNIWLPLFLLWPLLLVLALMLFPFVLVASLVVWYKDWGKPLFLFYPAVYHLFCALRGLRIDIRQGSDVVFFSFL